LFAGIDDVISVGDVIIVEEATEVVGLSDEREPAEVKLSLNDRDPEIQRAKSDSFRNRHISSEGVNTTKNINYLDKRARTLHTIGTL